MIQEAVERAVLKELEESNPAVARAFRTLRFRSQRTEDVSCLGETLSPMRTMFLYTDHMVDLPRQEERGMRLRRQTVWPVLIALALLGAGLVVLWIVAGPAIARFALRYWKYVVLPAGGLCLGAGSVLLARRVGEAPLRTVQPPNEDTKDPLQELRDLAERTGARLRAAYRLQLWAVLGVGALFVSLIVWSMVMVSRERLLYASTFGSSGVAMVILTQWKWQPFDRINQARRLADKADALAMGLRLRMRTVSEITDPSERAEAQWRAVSEYLALS